MPLANWNWYEKQIQPQARLIQRHFCIVSIVTVGIVKQLCGNKHSSNNNSVDIKLGKNKFISLNYSININEGENKTFRRTGRIFA